MRAHVPYPVSAVFLLLSTGLFLAACTGPGPGPVSRPAAAPRPFTTVSCISGKCHREIATKRYIHGPIGSGSCDTCHRVSQWKTGQHPSLLTDASGEKCLFCHEEVKVLTQMKHRHTPVANGECISCHEPHQSDNRFLLINGSKGLIVKTADLCDSCHDGFSSLKSSAFHGAVTLLDCSECHDPHASSDPFQLTHYVKTIYLRDHLALGRDALKAGDYQGALENLNLVLIVEPRELSALTLSIQCYLSMGDPESAKGLVERLLEVNPLNAEAHYLKGRVALASSQDFQALSSFQQSLSLKPDDPVILLVLGKLQIKRGMISDAMASLTKAAAVAPGDREVHQNLAEVYRSLGRTADAEKEKAILQQLDSDRKP